MFLRYLPSSITFTAATPSDSNYAAPSLINRMQMTCPAKSVVGYKSGPSIVSSYLEAIHCRKTAAQTFPASNLDALIARAQALDLACEGDHEFTPSEEGYVSFFNFMKAVDEENSYVTGTLRWTNSIAGLKQMIHQRGAALVEVLVAQSFMPTFATRVFDINTTGSQTALRHDYTKVFLAVGTDSTGLLVMNSLGFRWGKVGFARISWSVLEKNLGFEDHTEKERCFVKAASFDGCYNI